MTRKPEPRAEPPPALRAGGGIGRVSACRNSPAEIEDKVRVFGAHHAKAAYALAENIKFALTRHPVEEWLFLTLTFPDAVNCHTAAKRFSSARKHLLTLDDQEWLGIMERSKRTRLHFHLLFCRPGFNFRAGFCWSSYFDFKRLSYGKTPDERRRLFRPVAETAPQALRDVWAEFRRALPKYGFGRCEALPIRTTGGAVAAYVSKYLAKHIGQRIEDDYKSKSILAAANCRRAVTAIAWNSPGARQWRANVAAMSKEWGGPSFSAAFEAMVEEMDPADPERFRKAAEKAAAISGLAPTFGPRWAYQCYDAIMKMAHYPPPAPSEHPPTVKPFTGELYPISLPVWPD